MKDTGAVQLMSKNAEQTRTSAICFFITLFNRLLGGSSGVCVPVVSVTQPRSTVNGYRYQLVVLNYVI